MAKQLRGKVEGVGGGGGVPRQVLAEFLIWISIAKLPNCLCNKNSPHTGQEIMVPKQEICGQI